MSIPFAEIPTVAGRVVTLTCCLGGAFLDETDLFAYRHLPTRDVLSAGGMILVGISRIAIEKSPAAELLRDTPSWPASGASKCLTQGSLKAPSAETSSVEGDETRHFRPHQDGNGLDEPGSVSAEAPQPFPCPFCRGSRVRLIGAGRVFRQYGCVECAEVWTSLNAHPEPAPSLRPDPPRPVTSH